MRELMEQSPDQGAGPPPFLRRLCAGAAHLDRWRASVRKAAALAVTVAQPGARLDDKGPRKAVQCQQGLERSQAAIEVSLLRLGGWRSGQQGEKGKRRLLVKEARAPDCPLLIADPAHRFNDTRRSMTGSLS